MVVEIVAVVVVLLVIAAIVSGVRIVQQYERAVVFRLGRVLTGSRAPGLTVVIPFVDRVQKVNMQIITMSVPGQDGITKDNVSVRVDAVVYFRVVDPVKAVVNVQNYMFAVSQVAQTSLRAVIGRSDMDELLSDRDRINSELQRIIDDPTEGPWGVKIERVEIKDVALPESMKRSMSRQAEAERERRARVIAADGEFQASKRLAEAAKTMAADPAALQLRLLQTVVDVAAEKNSTLVMPFPVEILRFFDRAVPGVQSGSAPSTAPPATDLDLPLPDLPDVPPVEDLPDVEVEDFDGPAALPASTFTPAGSPAGSDSVTPAGSVPVVEEGRPRR
jgi:regulator of protease activity HflC (stomatin/prohibitin superfamily)